MKRAGLYRPDHVPPRVKMARILATLKEPGLTPPLMDKMEKDAKTVPFFHCFSLHVSCDNLFITYALQVLTELHASTSQEEYTRIRKDFSEIKEMASKRLRKVSIPYSFFDICFY